MVTDSPYRVAGARYVADFIHLQEIHMTQEQLNLFYKVLETKNSWGKNEIKTVLLEIASGIRTSL